MSENLHFNLKQINNFPRDCASAAKQTAICLKKCAEKSQHSGHTTVAKARQKRSKIEKHLGRRTGGGSKQRGFIVQETPT